MQCEVDQTVRVAPLIVVPANQLHEVVVSAMPAPMSTMEDAGQVTKSCETTSSSVQSRTPFISPAAASLIFATISSILAGLSKATVRSTT